MKIKFDKFSVDRFFSTVTTVVFFYAAVFVLYTQPVRSFGRSMWSFFS